MSIRLIPYGGWLLGTIAGIGLLIHALSAIPQGRLALSASTNGDHAAAEEILESLSDTTKELRAAADKLTEVIDNPKSTTAEVAKAVEEFIRVKAEWEAALATARGKPRTPDIYEALGTAAVEGTWADLEALRVLGELSNEQRLGIDAELMTKPGAFEEGSTHSKWVMEILPLLRKW